MPFFASGSVTIIAGARTAACGLRFGSYGDVTMFREALHRLNLPRPATTSLKRLVWTAHQRLAIEQQYQQLKDELGLDHFEGRTYPGWNRHVALTAVAYTFRIKRYNKTAQPFRWSCADPTRRIA